MDAELFWSTTGMVPARYAVLRHLSPMAHAGHEQLGVAAAGTDQLLAIIERRCATGQNAAAWQISEYGHYRDLGKDRDAAMTAVS